MKTVLLNKLKWLFIFLAFNLVYNLLYSIWWYKNKIFHFKDYTSFHSFLAIFYPILQIIFIVGAIYVGYKLGFFKKIRNTFKPKNLLFLGMITVVLFLVAFSSITIFMLYFPDKLIGNTESINTLTSDMPFISVTFLIPLSAGVFEELIYRGCIYNFFQNDKIAYMISSFYFAYIHAGFTWSYLIYLPLSLIITFSFHRRKRISDSMVVHSCYDLFGGYVLNFLRQIIDPFFGIF